METEEEQIEEQDEEDILPAGYLDGIGRFRILVSLLQASKNMNDVQFLLSLSSDINLFRLYMQYVDLDSVFDAVRYLFLAFPNAIKSKKIKTTFCENVSRIRSRIPNKL